MRKRIEWCQRRLEGFRTFQGVLLLFQEIFSDSGTVIWAIRGDSEGFNIILEDSERFWKRFKRCQGHFDGLSIFQRILERFQEIF